MKLILGIISISIVLSQNSIEPREFKVFKNNKNDKINIMVLINEVDGIFKVELIYAEELKYDRIKKILVLPCELEFDISSKISNKDIQYKLCKDEVVSDNYILVNKKDPWISFHYEKFNYVQGNLIFHITGEFQTKNSASYNIKDNGRKG